ncbi:MAG TPA: penicillin-binding protein 2 [Patescibacteria group bacterium]
MRQIRSTRQKSRRAGVADSNWRMHSLAVFVLLISLAILGKMVFLQVQKHAMYRALADSQHKSTTEIEARRGEIYMRDGSDKYPLAVNKEMQMAYAVPREMKDVQGAVNALSSILGLDRDFLQQKLGNPDDMFEILKHKLSDDEAQKIRDAKIAGIYLQGEDFRYYPAGELASQLVGFVGSDGSKQRGMYGLESYWDDALQGKSGTLQQEGDSRGRWIPVTDRSIQPAQDGPDIILTIDRTVQFEVEKILGEAVSSFQADSGTIVVMDPKTGKILALANQPSFDPNNYSQTQDISAFNNPAINQPYEPGSVFKVFTEAMGLEEGKISPDTTYVDKGHIEEAGYTIKNASVDPPNGYGLMTMTQVLEKSLNTGVIFIEKLVGNRTFADYTSRFGFGQKTGIDLPGELAGNIRNLGNIKSDINFFTASFGQGITATPIQLAAAYGAIANGGTLMKPYVVDKLDYPDGHEEVTQPEEARQVVSQRTAQQASVMLRDVVLNGSGKRADVPGYLVVGKTGTAQVAKEGGGGYQDGVTVGSFAGFAPMNDPQFVVIVKIVNPKTVQWAESSAGPTFGQVMKFLLQYYKVKPTEDPASSPQAKIPALSWPPFANNQSSQPAPINNKKQDSGSKNDSKSGSKVINSSD